MALPLLDAEQARNCARGNDVITQEILIISLAIIEQICPAGEFCVTVDSTTTVDVNGVIVTGSPMTNEDAYGYSVYAVWSGSAIDAKITEQLETVSTYFTKYGYSVSILSSNGMTISWKVCW